MAIAEDMVKTFKSAVALPLPMADIDIRKVRDLVAGSRKAVTNQSFAHIVDWDWRASNKASRNTTLPYSCRSGRLDKPRGLRS